MHEMVLGQVSSGSLIEAVAIEPLYNTMRFICCCKCWRGHPVQICSKLGYPNSVLH